MQEELVVTENTFQHKHGVMLLVSFGLLLCSMSIGAFCLLMPAISEGLGVPWPYVCWSLVSYFIVIAAFLNFFRQAAARFGSMRILRLGFILFGVGSLLSAFSFGWVSLLAFTLVRAIGAACLQATVICLFMEYIPLKIYPKAVHHTSFMLYFGLLIGFVLGGLIADWLSWRWVFACLAALSVVFCCLTLRIKEQIKGLKIHYDVLGVILFLVVCSSFIAGLGLASESGEYLPLSRTLFLITIISLLVFLFYEGRREMPFMKLSLYRSFSFSVVMFAKFTHSFVTTIGLIVPAVFLFYVKGLELYKVMLVAAIPALGITVSSVLDYFFNKKQRESFSLFVGIVLFVLPVAYFTLLNAASFDGVAFAALFFFGVGSGLMQQSLMRITFELLQEPPPLIGTIFRTMHNLGCGLAAAVATYFIGKYWLVEQAKLDVGLSFTLFFALILIVVALLFAGVRGISWLVGSSKSSED